MPNGWSANGFGVSNAGIFAPSSEFSSSQMASEHISIFADTEMPAPSPGWLWAPFLVLNNAIFHLLQTPHARGSHWQSPPPCLARPSLVQVCPHKCFLPATLMIHPTSLSANPQLVSFTACLPMSYLASNERRAMG